MFIPKEQLKQILVGEDLITPEKFDSYVVEADRKGQNLIEILISERVADANYFNNIVARVFGVEMANLANRAIDESILRTLPEQVARQRQVLLFGRNPDGSYLAALADPSNLETVEFLEQKLRAKIHPYLAITDDLNRGFAIYGHHSTEDFKKIIEDNIQESLRTQSRTAEEAAAQLPLVAIVDNILSYAMSMRASDIHIEPLEDTVLIRYRVDGMLYEVVRIPKVVHPAIVARIKILSGMKLDEHFKPQDGRFRYQTVNQVIDIRVSVMPTFNGEKVEMRLLEASQKPLSLAELGMLPEVAKAVNTALERTFGMVLICGPTGSGKTTTLYGIMNILNRPSVNICTIEDPIEFNMRYVNQSQINSQAGITFASGLRALLRQDPNIIMVGEIRDKETAGIAVQAALTGHLLLSSLHTNDAATAVPRLFDLDIPPFLVSSTLNMIAAQRLVRRVCNSCIYSYTPELNIATEIEAQFKTMNIVPDEGIIPRIYYRGKGCIVCGGTGYRGRLAIFEVINVTDPVRRVIAEPQFNLDELEKVARAEGSRSMFEDGLSKVQLGITTIEEVLRVIKE